ncbi:MAG: hypothetical protein H6Q24_1505 [Bacteroidetes bacterium]|nr:hypothetical protein [Bacteroidota bacterium]
MKFPGLKVNHAILMNYSKIESKPCYPDELFKNSIP